MDNNIGKICPACNGAINPGDNTTVCPSCGVEQHLNCWISNQGCAIPTCPSKAPAQPVVEQPAYQAPVQPVVEQPAYQAPVQPVVEQPAYQAPVQPAYPAADAYQAPAQPAYQAPVGPSVCPSCGTAVTGAFCPKCGTPASVGTVNPAVAQYNATVAAPKKKKTGLIIGIIVAVVVLIIIIASAGGDSGSGGGLLSTGPNFNSLYNQYCSSTWADVGSDGSYLRIDTNPYDWDDDGVAYTDAYYAVEDVNKALGLPDSLFEEMGETRGMDGKQTRTYSDKNLEVSWSYHPDKGLEVTYRKIR